LRADQLDSQIINVTPAATTQTVVVSGLIPATTYYFQVDATDSNGTVVQSTVISKTTK
jgi:chitodextrinase